jgi:hypothetical protein
LQIIGKGNKPAGITLVPRTARTIDLAIGERRDGPILIRHDGHRLDSRTAYRWVRSIGKRAGLDRVHPHMLRAAFIMPPPTPASRFATYRSPPAMQTREPPPSTTPTPELRPPRRLRPRRLRYQRLTGQRRRTRTLKSWDPVDVSGN